ncbi:L,D-transpeptidase family protein [Yoonia algicola]|uniref:L,D-transpeptidase family protein n=1 Tax=Yoonia algicola TaxID=3137368 RepID=A0AAN0M0P9_9RHOB
MISRRSLIAGSAAFGLAGCASHASVYTGPDVTRIQVLKERREMQLLNNRTLLKSYKIDLGFSPAGHKTQEGDGRTPEGGYRIDRRNPNSRFHLSLGISYPDANDLAYAQAKGIDPGGDIFIHGTPQRWMGTPDWTWGCIAVTNEEMDEVYAMVNTGTLIYIYA